MFARVPKAAREDGKSWEANLFEEHETDNLRREEAEWRRREDAKKKVERRRSSSTSRSRKKKKKKEKKKKAETEKEGVPDAPGGNAATRKMAAKKPLESLYRGTGFDPDVKARRSLI